jgi:hypothetical protein
MHGRSGRDLKAAPRVREPGAVRGRVTMHESGGPKAALGLCLVALWRC